MSKSDAPPDARPFRFAIVASEFHRDVSERLLTGARECLEKHGSTSIREFWVPGAFELPLAASVLAGSGRYDAIVCVGCVIRGETPHFEYVSAGAAQGLTTAMLQTGVPMAFGVLTTDTHEQAAARAGGDRGNKGWDAALTAVQMAAFIREAGV